MACLEMEAPLRAILPFNYKYQVLSFVSGKGVDSFEATVRINISTEEEAKQWLSEMQSISSLEFRIARTYPSTKNKLVFKNDYRCHHNTRASFSSRTSKKPSSKNTDCRAVLRITVKNPKMKRSKDIWLTKYPGEVNIKNIHNHLIKSVDVLRYRRPSEETTRLVKELFRKGHSPTSALDIIKYDLQQEFGANYFLAAADGAKCPSLQHMYYLFYRTFNKEYWSPCTVSSCVEVLIENAPRIDSEKIINNKSSQEEFGCENAERIILLKEKANKLFNNLELHNEESLKSWETFFNSYDSLRTESALISALSTFGKNQVTLKQSRKRSYIPVQPTSVAQRKAYLGGRKVQLKGWPAKGAKQGGPGEEKQWLVPLKRRKRSALHSLKK